MLDAFKNSIERWLRGESAPPLGVSFALTIASKVYAFVVKLRLKLYSRGVLKKKRLPCMVISIGNITVGGTGKTPMTIHIARRFVKEYARVVILSRGYKGTNKGVAVVSDGIKILMDPQSAGDEPCLMAKKLLGKGLSGVPVIISPDRYMAGMVAIEKFSPDVIILDDGFQHIGLIRDHNILLVDSKIDLSTEKTLPAGRLREPIRGILRAGVIMIKDRQGPVSDPILKKINKPMADFSYRTVKLDPLFGASDITLAELKGKRVFLFSAIASPGSFKQSVEDAGAIVCAIKHYPDHYSLTDTDIEEVKRLSKDAQLIITTEKDAVKLARLGPRAGIDNFYALAIEVVIDKEENFFRKIR